MFHRRSFMAALSAAAVTVAVGAAVLLPSQGASAQTSSADPGAAGFIKSLGDRAISTFSDKSHKEKARDKFKHLLTEGFDIPYISRWVIGRYWNTATDAQRGEYQSLFEKMIVDTYAGRFAEYSGETLKVVGSRGEGDTDTSVFTQIVRPSGPPVNVDWRVRKNGTAYKIIDVAVEGVSMGVTQRSEFASIIQNGGGNFDSLLQALRSKTAAKAG